MCRLALAMAALAGSGVLSAQPADERVVIIGGSDNERLYDVAVDAAGNVYAVGETFSADFPVLGGIQSTRNGAQDAFIVKLDSSGQLLYSTYLGGSGFDSARSVVVDSAGNAYVAGYTTSANFPLQNPLDANRGGASDGFIAKLGPQGDVLLFSTYFGGSSEDSADAMAIDAQGNLYVSGRTSGGLATINAAQATYGGNDDAFVLRLNAALDAYGYVSYLGGAQLDYANAIGVDASGRACVAGFSGSIDFPRVNPSQPPPGGTATQDGFYALFATAGTALEISSLLGGSGQDNARGVACNATHLAVVGETASTDFPTGAGSAGPGQSTPAGVQSVAAGGKDAFVSVIRPADGTRVYSTLRGGLRDEAFVDVSFDADGSLLTFGATASSDLPDGTGGEVDLDGAGVFRTNDDGATWQATGLQGMAINDLATAATVPPTLLAATDRGLWVSTDGGNVWNVPAGSLPERVVNAVVVDPTLPCRWTIGVDATGGDAVGAGRTTDCGATWSPLGEPAAGVVGMQRLGDPDRWVVNINRNSTHGDGTLSDTCVWNDAGEVIDCFGRGTSANLVATHPTAACRWYEADRFSGNVYAIGAGVAGCNPPFSSQGTGAPFAQPVTALAVVPAEGVEPSRGPDHSFTGWACSSNGITANLGLPPEWLLVPGDYQSRCTAMGIPEDGALKYSANSTFGSVERNGSAAYELTDDTGAMGFGDIESGQGQGQWNAGTARGTVLLSGTFGVVDPAIFRQSANHGSCFQEPGAAALYGYKRLLASTLEGKCGAGSTSYIGENLGKRNIQIAWSDTGIGRIFGSSFERPPR